MNYIDKLKGFNNTQKYHDELDMILMHLKWGQKILDYGCGLGYAVNHFNSHGLDVSGYDKNHFNPDFEYSDAVQSWDVVYFMHSFAHIPSVKMVLEVLDTKKIVIVTPNKRWIDNIKNENYVPDPTVIEHYTLLSLIDTVVEAGYDIIEASETGEYLNGSRERLFLVAKKS